MNIFNINVFNINVFNINDLSIRVFSKVDKQGKTTEARQVGR